MKIDYKRYMLNIFQILLGISCATIIGLLFSLFIWTCILFIFEWLGRVGINFNLAGNGQEVAPGALIVAGLYLLLNLTISYKLYKRNRFEVFAISFGLCSIIVSVLLLGVVGSMIWL